LEQFNHLHSHDKGDGDEVSQEKPPGGSKQPVVRRRNVGHDCRIAVLQNCVEKRANERDNYLPNEDLNDSFVHLHHQLRLLWLKFGTIQHHLRVSSRVTANSNDLVHCLECASSQHQITTIERYLDAFVLNHSVEFVELHSGCSTGDPIWQGLVVLIFGDVVGDVTEEGHFQLEVGLSIESFCLDKPFILWIGCLDYHAIAGNQRIFSHLYDIAHSQISPMLDLKPVTD